VISLPQFPNHRTCTVCPLHSTPNLHSPGLSTIWLPDSQPPTPGVPVVFFIGQNPGFREDMSNAPFMGTAGVLVRGSPGPPPRKGVFIDGIQLRSRASIYLSYMARCSTFGEIEPTPSNYAACLPHTLQDMRIIADAHGQSPLYVVVLGAHACGTLTKALCGKKQSLNDMMAKNGTPFTWESREWRIYATWNPAYLLRNPKMIYSVSDHMKLLSDSLAGVTPPPSSPTVILPRMPILVASQ